MAIINGRIASVPVWIIERAASLPSAVGRIAVRDGRGFGTGFLVSPQVVLTCRHVVPDRETSAESVIEFDYRDDRSGTFRPVTRVALKTEMVLADARLDCALLRLVEPVTNRSWIPLRASVEPALGQQVTLIHHPEAGPLKVAFRDGEIIAAKADVLHHTAGSMPGSAGAPLFDEQLRLIGLHHATVPSPHSNSSVAGWSGPIANEAIRIDAIARLLVQSGVEWVREVLEHDDTVSSPSEAARNRAPSRVEATTEFADSTAAQERSSVFISYARDDQPEGQWRDRLRTFLQPFAHQLDVWDDSRIQTGAEWRAEIDRALKRARVAILLVGPHFLASEFIAKNELPPLLERAAEEAVQILPLITNECSYGRTPLGRYQTFNNPDEPLEALDRAKQNRVLRQFAEKIYDALGGHPDV